MLYRYIIERPGGAQQQMQIEGEGAYCTIETCGALVFFRIVDGREHMVKALAHGQWTGLEHAPPTADAPDVYVQATHEAASS